MLKALVPGLIGLSTGIGASLCCVAPLAIAALGIGSGSFMLVTMQYRWLLYPLGLAGLAAGYALHFRRKRACDRQACRFSGGRTSLALLAFATVLMVLVTYVDFLMVSV